jgi:thiamine pyrophosphate-dependent acetolactate synthase large subunit-like protein
MKETQVLEVLAQAFVQEGTKVLFTLMGDANMYWSDCMARQFGVRNIHVMHEHSAVSMADAYARFTGEVGVASVTSGPGLTQTATALTAAVRGKWPVVLFAGDTPMNAAFHLQTFDQGPFVATTGAHFIPVRHVDRMLDNVREAFYVARVERRPVVLSVPMDLQKEVFPHFVQYQPSLELVPTAQRPAPDPEIVERALDMIAQAERPMILAGRGAVRSGAGKVLVEVAEQCGALLGTSLLGKGLFDDQPYSVGTAGAFATDPARELWAECDLVIGVGAGLGHYTTEAGYLYPNAKVIHIDTHPHGLFQGLRIADLYIQADALAAARVLLQRLRERGVKRTGIRSRELAMKLEAALAQPDPKPFPIAPGTVDPRAATLELDRVIPKDWDIVVGSAHFFSIALTHMRGRAPERYHIINDFAACGSGLAATVGLATARGDGKVLLVDGDGSMKMQIQELDTAARHKVKFLACVFNDGSYASEAHKFRAFNMDPSEVMHGRCDFAAISKAFGLRGETVTTLGRFAELFAAYEQGGTTAVWDVHIDEKLPSKLFRRVWFGEV